MTNFAPVLGLVGGARIGLAAIILMLTVGRIAGVSGIVLNALTASDAAGRSWRLAFILGLPLGALLVTAVGLKDWSGMSFLATMPTTVIAGFITTLFNPGQLCRPCNNLTRKAPETTRCACAVKPPHGTTIISQLEFFTRFPWVMSHSTLAEPEEYGNFARVDGS